MAALMAGVAGEPRYVPMIIADKTCALAASNAITAALFARERTGRGQFVEIPMFETMAFFILTEHLYGHTFVPPEAPLGYSRLLAPWRRPYKTKDGHICMLAYTDPQWRKFWDRGRQAGAGSRSALRHAGKPKPQHRRGLSDSPASASAAARRTNGWRSSRISKSRRRGSRVSTR